mmetsp:Transcript_13750/g.37814  ORF Transcript_13750/g.37814 Transcript_13750/m.37814 type:complete len:186 (-) Transcript_13750:908-1465(-)
MTTDPIDTSHDDDDDFFGDGDDEDNDDLNDFDRRAMEERHKTIGYVDAFDAHKEERLQEGFEAGYRESYDASILLGRSLGSMIARGKLSMMMNEATATEQKKNTDSMLDGALKARDVLQAFDEEAAAVSSGKKIKRETNASASDGSNDVDATTPGSEVPQGSDWDAQLSKFKQCEDELWRLKLTM